MIRHHNIYQADTARITGDVHFGDDVSVWYSAVIRGDVARISIGTGSNVQDGAVVHSDSGEPNVIGDRVVIGHGAIVHGRSIGDDSLIGMGATVLGGTVIGKGCLIAAGAVVPPGLEVPDGHVVMGLPGKIRRETTDQERAYMAWLSDHYTHLAALYADQPDHPRVRVWNGNPGEAIDHPETPEVLR